MRARLVPFLLLCAATVRGQTGPRLVEEAATAPAGTIVLEARADWIADEPSFLSGLPRDRHDAPLLRLVYSPAGNVELDLEWVARVGVSGDPDLGSASDWGDVTLRAKVRLAEGRTRLGARLAVSLPQTSFTEAALGPNALRASAQVLLDRPLGRLTVHGNLGLALHDEVLRPHEQRDFAAYGLALSGRLGKRSEGFLEVAGRAGDGQPGADAHSELRAGASLRRGRFAWDAALRRGLGEADGNWGFTIGGRVWLRPHAGAHPPGGAE